MNIDSVNSINIGVFGDSIGKGIIFNSASKRYEALKINVQKITGRNPVNIKNYSIMGCTISKGIEVIKRQADKLKDFQNVFLEFGGNDCDFEWNKVAANPLCDHQPKTPPEDFEKLYVQALDFIISKGGKPIMLTLPPLSPERYLDWIAKNNNKYSILKWLGSADTIYRWQEMYNMKIALLAAKLSVKLIDIRSAFLQNHFYRELLCADGIHPNKAGHELIYKTIIEQYTAGGQA